MGIKVVSQIHDEVSVEVAHAGDFCALKQALNSVAQSGAQGLMKGTLNRASGKIDIKRRNEYRLNKENSRYVELIVGHVGWGETLGPEQFTWRSEDILWWVEDVLTGDCYKLKESSIGAQVTEMEVIAWAAK